MQTLLGIFCVLNYYIRRYDPCIKGRVSSERAFPSTQQTSVGCTHTHTHALEHSYMYIQVSTTRSLLYLPVERTLECSHLPIYYMYYTYTNVRHAQVQLQCTYIIYYYTACVLYTGHGQKKRPRRDLRTVCEIKRFEYTCKVEQSLHL